MSTPLDEHALDFLHEDARRVIKDMLKSVVEHPDIYYNGFSITRLPNDNYQYFLGNSGQPGPFTNNQRLPFNVMESLMFHGIARGKIDHQLASDFRSFTEAALEWYRTYGGLSPDEVRKGIGRFLRRYVGRQQLPEYRIEEVAATVGASIDQIREQTHVLLGVGLVERVFSGTMEFGVLGLTEPRGLLWAESGYPPIHSLSSQIINVNLDLRVEIHNIIEQARATDLPDETIEQFELLLHRAEEELEKPPGQGRFKRIQELTEFAANVKEFIPLIGRLFVEHGDKIQQLSDLVS